MGNTGMGEKEKQEYRKQGFLIFELWQFIVLIGTILFAVGGFFALTQNTLAAHEKKLETIEAWETAHESKQIKTETYRIRKIDEVGFNLKALCQKFGVKYTPTEEINKPE